MNKLMCLRNCLVLLIFFSITTIFFVVKAQKQKGLAKYKIIANHPARASPVDSCRYSIQINGTSNIVMINDSIMESNPDSTAKQNNIRVTGEGNTITVLQNDNKLNSVTVIQNETNSKVTISQSGNKNKINILQSIK